MVLYLHRSWKNTLEYKKSFEIGRTASNFPAVVPVKDGQNGNELGLREMERFSCSKIQTFLTDWSSLTVTQEQNTVGVLVVGREQKQHRCCPNRIQKGCKSSFSTQTAQFALHFKSLFGTFSIRMLCVSGKLLSVFSMIEINSPVSLPPQTILPMKRRCSHLVIRGSVSITVFF